MNHWKDNKAFPLRAIISDQNQKEIQMDLKPARAKQMEIYFQEYLYIIRDLVGVLNLLFIPLESLILEIKVHIYNQKFSHS